MLLILHLLVVIITIQANAQPLVSSENHANESLNDLQADFWKNNPKNHNHESVNDATGDHQHSGTGSHDSGILEDFWKNKPRNHNHESLNDATGNEKPEVVSKKVF